MSLTPSPNEPSTRTMVHRSTLERFADWVRVPFPVRVGIENRFRWLVDAFIAFVLWIVGALVAGLLAEAMPFLGPLAYPVGLILGWFPVGMWMHYCRVPNKTGIGAILLVIAALLASFAFKDGFRGLLFLPLAFAVLGLILPLELAVGRQILGWLPSSSARQRPGQ